MKKILSLGLCLILAFLCIAVKPLRAQETKKVAILEVVDKQGNVDYGVKFLLRSTMAKVITNTYGYEGYTRVDVSAVMEEQAFQQSGLVSDAEIRKLGELSGAAYVLLTEAARIDASHLIITASVLDVETARMENTETLMSGVSPGEIEESCRRLAVKLFKVTSVDGSERMDESLIREMYFHMKNGKVYNQDGERMASYELRSFFGDNTYHEWEKQCRKRATGNGLVITGVVLAVAGSVALGLMPSFEKKKEEYENAWYDNGYLESDEKGRDFYNTMTYDVCLMGGPSALGVGSVLAITGGIVSGSAKKKMNRMLKYGNRYTSSAEFTFGTQYYGTGFALRF